MKAPDMVLSVPSLLMVSVHPVFTTFTVRLQSDGRSITMVVGLNSLDAGHVDRTIVSLLICTFVCDRFQILTVTKSIAAYVAG